MVENPTLTTTTNTDKLGTHVVATGWTSRGVFAGTLNPLFNQPMYAPYVEQKPAAIRDGLVFRAGRGLQWTAGAAVDFAGPLSVYAALTVSSAWTSAPGYNIPFLKVESDIPTGNFTSAGLWFGCDWFEPSVYRMTHMPVFMQQQLAASNVDWSASASSGAALRVLAISLPKLGSPEACRWYLGDGQWKQGTGTDGGGATPSPNTRGFQLGYGGTTNPENIPYTLHELRIIPTCHNPSTMTSIYNELVTRWA